MALLEGKIRNEQNIMWTPGVCKSDSNQAKPPEIVPVPGVGYPFLFRSMRLDFTYYVAIANLLRVKHTYNIYIYTYIYTTKVR